jgi:hypothetical protein
MNILSWKYTLKTDYPYHDLLAHFKTVDNHTLYE